MTRPGIVPGRGRPHIVTRPNVRRLEKTAILIHRFAHVTVGWHALRYSEGRGSVRDSHALRSTSGRATLLIPSPGPAVPRTPRAGALSGRAAVPPPAPAPGPTARIALHSPRP